MLSQFKCLGFYIQFVKEGWIEQFKKAEMTLYIFYTPGESKPEKPPSHGSSWFPALLSINLLI